MENASKVFVTVYAVMMIGGCAQGASRRVAETSGAVHTAEGIAVLSFLNDQQNVTFETLDQDCGLRSDAARNLIDHRDGQDQAAGTGDDNMFDTLEEVDDVPMVGDAAMRRLTLCAESFGYKPTQKELSVLNFLNDRNSTTVELLDDACGLRSDAARNLIAHRNGPDGVANTPDDDLFFSAAEVDSVPQVGSWTMDRLFECAETFGFVWSPIPLTFEFTALHPAIGVTQEDGVIWVDGRNAPYDAELLVRFDGHELSFRKGPVWFGFSGVGRGLPPGYGGESLGEVNGVEKFRITRDPEGTLTTDEALQAAREGLVYFLKEDRMKREDWLAQCPSFTTWEAALEEGIMDGVNGFGDPSYDSQTYKTSTPTTYEFSGRGPFYLYTRVVVSKETGKPIHFYVEID